MIKSIFSMAVVRLLTLGFPLVIIPLLIRILGLDNYGHYAVIFAIATILGTIINYGFDYTASRDLSLAKSEKEKSQLFSIFLICKIIIFIFLLVLGILVALYKSYPLWDMAALLIYSLSQVITPVYVFQGLKRMEYLIINSLILNVTYLILLLFISANGYIISSGFLFCCYGAISSIAALAMLVYIHKYFHIYFIKVNGKQIKQKFQDGLAIFFSRMCSMSLSQVGLVILAHTLSSSALGYYAVGDKVVRASNSIFYAFQQATYPYFCEKKESKKFSLLLLFLVVSAMIGVLVINYMSDYIATILLHAEYDGKVFQYISWSLIPMAISGMIGVNYLLANGMNKTFSVLLFSGAVINLILLFLLSQKYSWQGAVFAMIGTETFIALTMTIIYIFKEHFPGRNI
ncbi:oligosaccharide flippase family protein [Mixta calida]|uniref:oligosaccharide flippase family protein n=1 Tax=Mixta calida TaxID=665913 RepID=UPI0005363F05|nr:oligosaccharide flippase family protein [Mixta calida]AIX73217.1 hypothetical protein PSNIH2_05145 [Pantoea sp. PSNIH2]MDU5770431.1 oligosaccharide flippase family protein [Mixta calida]POU40036.1 hypothetical protein C3380_23775 [Pantoea sp. PSNIH5]POU58942.1 hypothetical protein C3374_23320 [Pantoea sp. PSNIH4]